MPEKNEIYPITELVKCLPMIEKLGLKRVEFQYEADMMRQIIYFTNGKKYMAFWFEPPLE